LPEANAYYDAALAAYTYYGVQWRSERCTRLGQREVIALTDQAGRALTEAGFIGGSVAKRLQALAALAEQPPMQTMSGARRACLATDAASWSQKGQRPHWGK